MRSALWGLVGTFAAEIIILGAGTWLGTSPMFQLLALAIGVIVTLLFLWLPPLRDLELRWPVRRAEHRSTCLDTDAERVSRYQRNQGLFLVHKAATPSRYPGQKADVTIRLAQHGDGPLSKGTVASVEYVLGKQFEDHARVRTNPRDGFALEESLYAPLLVLARVGFTDGTPDLLLERYINFPGDGGEHA